MDVMWTKMKNGRPYFDKLRLAIQTGESRFNDIKRNEAVPILTNRDWPRFLKTPKP